jgi:hypothetical protein
MNPNLPRLKPNPIPKIAPIPEHLAEPALKEIYEDTKAALQVPWMGVVAMSFAALSAILRHAVGRLSRVVSQRAIPDGVS